MGEPTRELAYVGDKVAVDGRSYKSGWSGSFVADRREGEADMLCVLMGSGGAQTSVPSRLEHNDGAWLLWCWTRANIAVVCGPGRVD